MLVNGNAGHERLHQCETEAAIDSFPVGQSPLAVVLDYDCHRVLVESTVDEDMVEMFFEEWWPEDDECQRTYTTPRRCTNCRYCSW